MNRCTAMWSMRTGSRAAISMDGGTSPTGEEVRVPLEWTVERDGEYAAEFTPEENGLYDIRVEVELVKGRMYH